MMRVFILGILLALCGLSFGQKAVIELKGSISDDDNGKGLSGAVMEVYKNGVLIDSKISASNGKVDKMILPICMDCRYTVHFKKDGYVTKTAIVDGRFDYPDELGPGVRPIQFDVSIFQSIEGIDFTFLLNEAMVEYELNNFGEMEYDQQKIKVMIKKIEDLKKKIEQKKEELEKEAAEKSKKEADFNAYVAAGDAAMKQQDFDKAIGQYELALGIRPGDKPTEDKITDAKIKRDELLAKAQLDKDFGAKMQAGKEAYAKGELEKALGFYKEAEELKPLELQPKTLIKEIEDALAKQKANQAAFTQLVADGDAAVNKEDFDTGILKYEAALKLKKDAIVETKLAETKKLKEEKANALAAEKANQLKYEQLMAQAEGEFKGQNYEAAKKSYQEAQKLKPDEAKPAAQLAEIEKLLKAQAAEQAAKDKLEADYANLMNAGKEKINQRTYPEAKAKFEEALKLKPGDPDAKAQIDLVNKEIEKQAADAKLNADYEAKMQDAKALFDQKKYIESKAKYNEALLVKPLEQAPKDQIKTIDLLIRDAEKAAKAEADYTKFMDLGKAANDRKAYTEAISNYQKALEAKPEDADAKARIDAINKTIEEQNKLAADQKKFDDFVAQAQQAFNAKDLDKAKLNYTNALEIKDDAEINKKIAEIDDLIAKNQRAQETKAKYDAAIKEADALFAAKDFEKAKEKYTAAFSIQENDYPKKQIALINEKLNALEAEATKEKQFADFKKAGDDAYAGNDYAKALENYKEAINVKPDPTLTSKIAELNAKIVEEAQNADKKAKFDQKMKEADAAYDAKNWLGAKALYEEADRIIPSETRPDSQLAEIKTRIAEEANAAEQAKYQKIIDEGDALLKADKLDPAKVQYDQALILRPRDSYATAQLQKIADIKKEQAAKIAAEKELEATYTAIIKEGEKAENTNDWSLALEKYKAALLLKPLEIYPQDKIKEMERKMGTAELQKQKDTEYQTALTKGDQLLKSQDYEDAISAYRDALLVKPNETYPKDKIASAEEFIRQRSSKEADEAYKKLVSDAQAKLDQKDYQAALTLFQEAKRTKPTDPLPQQRIDEINQILAKSGEADKLEEQYRDYLKEADYRFEKGEWSKAKESYIAAYNLFNREYPEKKIDECEGAMKQATLANENRQYDKIIKTADEYFAGKNYDKAKDLYERALKLKPGDEYPKTKLAEIEAILNPQTFGKNQKTLPNYGSPDRSANAVDVDRMLANAEAQRKFNEQVKVEQQRLDAADAETVNSELQTEYSYETREDVVEFWEVVAAVDFAADEEVEVLVENIEEMNIEYIEFTDRRVTYNENDIQLQNQVVDNINLSIDERDDLADEDREAYELDLENIQLELVVESSEQDAGQTNVTYEMKETIEEYSATRIEDDERKDTDRKNTEIDVEDKYVQLINEENSNTWDQEDLVFELKAVTEDEIIERTANELAQDLPRENEEVFVEAEIVELLDVEVSRTSDQYDINLEAKTYTENEIIETELQAVGNDVPRIQMEDFSEEQYDETSESNSELIMDQNNVLFVTDVMVENQEIALVENQVESDQNREGYEENVEVIFDDTDIFVDLLASDNENGSHKTVNYLEDQDKERLIEDKEADQEADLLIDETADLVEENNKTRNGDADEAAEKVEESEDFVESIRDIDVSEIDEKMKNSLGDQFPEGVTEEIYTINDEDGLMVSYIVRRVVVRNGVGNVYEKVQTKFGTTSYTCNGYGISEFEWQDQTESADLVRN